MTTQHINETRASLRRGVWCPWAAMLCPTCHNSDQRAIDRTSQVDRDEIARPLVAPEPWHQPAPCDKCDTLCWFADDVAIPALVLRAVADAQPLDGGITGNMWQTGGMCPAAALKCEGDPRLIVVTALDADLCVGVYDDVAAWDDFDEDRADMFMFGEGEISRAVKLVLDTFNTEEG